MSTRAVCAICAGDLQGGQAVNRAAAVEQVDRDAAELGDDQAGDDHEHGAAEQGSRQQPHQLTRSTTAAST
ncbi:MAG TPA: hypothetical protein VEX61_12825 [Burkholderiales bacterium]|nr:hypothetical protein [Burkholderiales bacterium]